MNTKKTETTFYAVTGGPEPDCLMARANTDLLRDARSEAMRHRYADVWRITETGPNKADRVRALVFSVAPSELVAC